MSAFDFEANATGYSPTNAYALAVMAELAYATPAVIKRRLKSLDFDEDRLEVIGVKGGTQVFVAATGEALIVSFRGTQADIGDWLNNLLQHLTGGPLGGKVHEGFAGWLYSVWADVMQAIRDGQEDQEIPLSVWLTGHSLGGALATLAVAKLIERAEPVNGLYTFGCPRCGDDGFATAFQANFARAYRLVNRNDIVTRIPPRPLYHHVGTVKYIDENCQLRGEQDGWMPFVRSVKYTIEDLRQVKLGSVKAHDISAYIECLDKQRRPAAPGAAS